MVDITEISAIVAAAGVLVGVVYYILDIRHQTKIRQTDMLWRISASSKVKEFVESAMKLQCLEFKDYNDFVKKYGPIVSENPVSIAFAQVSSQYEAVGILLHRRLVDLDLVSEFIPVTMTWEKLKPIIEGARQQYNAPKFLKWFEYLYDQIRKREQQLQQRGVKSG